MNFRVAIQACNVAREIPIFAAACAVENIFDILTETIAPF